MSTTIARPFVDPAALTATVEAVSARRELGQVTFTAFSESAGGLTSRTETGPLLQAGVPDETRHGKYTLHSDEPVPLLGTDTAPSPAEYVLKALAGCYIVTLSTLAASRNITLEKIQLTLSFDINLSGFLGIDDSVRKGATSIQVDVELESPDAPREVLADLAKALETTSPIRDTLANPVQVITTLV